jgi:type I restriction enzyme, S subunit
MNAERLLGHYERIADAPEAILRLRQFILDLAVRGKLVLQDLNDEPASELLKRIAAEKARLLKAGVIKKQEPLPPIEDDALLLRIPDGWSLARLAAISRRIHYGFTASADSARKGVRLLRITDIQDIAVDWSSVPGCAISEREVAQYKLEKGDILIARTGGTIGKTFLVRNVPVIAVFASYLIRVQSLQNLHATYLKLFLESPVYWSQLRDGTRGTGQPNVNGQTLGQLLVTLPPLAEQHRIVAKVDELMALCDRLEAARTEREARRDVLAAVSFARLDAPDPDPATFANDARFALNNLAVLTTRSDQLKQLRQVILNLAVRGRLVPQDPNDDAASELLKRIAKEKARLVKEGKSKRQEPLPEPDLDQAPFELPSGWTWGRFPELGTFGRGKSKHRPRNDPALFASGTHLMIQTGDVARSQGVIETFTNKYNDLGLSQSFKWPKGTLCITIAANIADSGILSFDACFPDSVVGFVPAAIFENARYFEYFVRTAKANLLEFAPATAQKNINLEILTSVLIPLPPLAEQHRIVAKVDALMALCDRLVASLIDAGAIRRRLLDALLAEALAPGKERELEAAE